MHRACTRSSIERVVRLQRTRGVILHRHRAGRIRAQDHRTQRHRSHAILARECHRARCRFARVTVVGAIAIGHLTRATRLGATRSQAFFINQQRHIGRGRLLRLAHRWRHVANFDLQHRMCQIPVRILDRVGELIRLATGAARRARVAVATVGIQLQCAV